MSLGRAGIAVTLAACFLFAACGGDDAHPGMDVLVSFEYSQCSQPIPLASGFDVAALDGLQCVVAATPEGGGWSVALVNFVAGCTVEDQGPWIGTATVYGEGTLALNAVWQAEYPNGCGQCRYAFEYALEPFEFEQPLDLELAVSDCSSTMCAEPALATSIFTDSETPVLSCRYIIGTTGWGGLVDFDGSGGGCYREPAEGGCADGLVPRAVATELEPSLTLCLPACDVDEDCPLPEIETCEDGACVIGDPLALTEA